MIDDVPAFVVWFWPMEANKKFSDFVVTDQIWQRISSRIPCCLFSALQALASLP